LPAANYGGISLISIIPASVINQEEARGESAVLVKALIYGMMMRISQRRCRSLKKTNPGLPCKVVPEFQFTISGNPPDLFLGGTNGTKT
jgi:hypothetical protein